MTSLQGKSIIITGAGSGIGAAAALLAGRRGARVTLADVNEAGGRHVAEEIVTAGGEAQFVRTDISQEAQVEAMVSAATTAFGALHGAFNNAGVPAYSHRGKGSTFTLFADLDVDIFRKGLAVNVVGTFLCMKYEIRAMLEGGGGAIVNTSSGAGILAIAGAADYIAAKHGVIGLTKSAALDYATNNIRVNALLPGVTRTGMMEASFSDNPELYNWAADMQPTKRIGNAAEVAEGALWLLSDAASFVTGISLPVDGGYSMV
jgi:2,5-dichloro-2,5-cyclohexadiene-1,4-diol dehydrogenase 1